MSAGGARIAGLRTIIAEPKTAARLSVVALHGYAMMPEDLSPFAASLDVPARFYFPEGPRAVQPNGRAWWDFDPVKRAESLARGPRDLFQDHYEGTAPARSQLLTLLNEVRSRDGGLPLVLVGFSQGGMLAMDLMLRERPPVTAMALLSSTRIAFDEWEPLADRLRGLPVLISHGQKDDDLAFAAGEALRDFATKAGAAVTWVPFDEGHAIPLLVWRALRKFLQKLVPTAP